MRVIGIKHVEDCFDGSSIKELLFDSEITKELVFSIGREGDMQYFEDFARPFFKIRIQSKYDLKGIVGNRTIRVHLMTPTATALSEFLDEYRIEYDDAVLTSNHG